MGLPSKSWEVLGSPRKSQEVLGGPRKSLEVLGRPPSWLAGCLASQLYSYIGTPIQGLQHGGLLLLGGSDSGASPRMSCEVLGGRNFIVKLY